MTRKTISWISWPVRILLAFGFTVASIGKITGSPAMLEMFQHFGYPNWFCIFIGVAELSGAILLLIPKTSLYTSIGLVVIMIGALVTHLVHDPFAKILGPAIYLFLLTINIYLYKKGQAKKNILV